MASSSPARSCVGFLLSDVEGNLALYKLYHADGDYEDLEEHEVQEGVRVHKEHMAGTAVAEEGA